MSNWARKRGDVDWQCMGTGIISQDISARRIIDETGEKDAGLRQGVKSMESDLQETGNGMENVTCSHCIKVCIKTAHISLLKASTNF